MTHTILLIARSIHACCSKHSIFIDWILSLIKMIVVEYFFNTKQTMFVYPAFYYNKLVNGFSVWCILLFKHVNKLFHELKTQHTCIYICYHKNMHTQSKNKKKLICTCCRRFGISLRFFNFENFVKTTVNTEFPSQMFLSSSQLERSHSYLWNSSRLIKLVCLKFQKNYPLPAVGLCILLYRNKRTCATLWVW